MASYISYQNLDFRIENETFYSTKISLSAQASVAPVLLSDGSLLNYAPEGAVVGSLNGNFYLTGALPSYFDITGSYEAPITVKFANVNITGVYPKSISFSVEPFQPVMVDFSCDWYGNVSVEDFSEESVSTKSSKQIPQYIANAYRSSLTTNNLDGVGYINNFTYNASCDRPAFFKINEKFPFRIAKVNKASSISLKSNKLGSLLDINGKTVSTVVTLKDLYGTSLQTFNVSGVMTSQNYEISERTYMLTSADISQTVPTIKTLV